ncbi:3-methyl-2-oxobutanoate hydroxymethyltransferase [Ceraceosorus bombacis]|uniref:3-methyl-2-oxobutanoate hydroxymethyltransferase n=1 Tax=Ceraceosorus bombacis TaxID=401625 RepID=A0A0P1B863_9BASI|nr:3-methyl-2-oxobutanoate hydroxymethyltransferase [Ceraceosorus bombacis]
MSTSQRASRAALRWLGEQSAASTSSNAAASGSCITLSATRNAQTHSAPKRCGAQRNFRSDHAASLCPPRGAKKHFSTSSSSSSFWPAGTAPPEDEPQWQAGGGPPSNVGAGAAHRKTGSASMYPSPASVSASIAQSDTHRRSEGARLVSAPPPKTVHYIAEMKRRGQAITVLTAYDYPTALAHRSADIDICLIGDSLANVGLGHGSTQRLSVPAMVHHIQTVVRGLSSPLLSGEGRPALPLVIADMPFGSFFASVEEGVKNALALIKEGGADGVKIEGGQEIVPLVERLTDFGIPVMAHIGLQPQRAAALSGLTLRGRTAEQAISIVRDARALDRAGCFAGVVECVPNKVAKEISKRVGFATIGIGAGPATDGQVLVINDILGDLTGPAHVLAGLQETDHASNMPLPLPHAQTPRPPKFVRNFAAQATGGATLGSIRIAAVRAYVEAVRNRDFPNEDVEGYKIKREELEQFRKLLSGEDANDAPKR